jgi:outer membrane protein OmpA-like peptidoglycan-associated protein
MSKLKIIHPVSASVVAALSCNISSTAFAAHFEHDPVRSMELASNTEQQLVQKHFVLHALEAVSATEVTQTQTEQVAKKADYIKDSAIRFVSGKHFLTGSTKREMDFIIGQLRGKKQLKLHFIGHADSQRLSPNAKKIYKTNQGLSEHRADIVAAYFRQQLDLTSEAITAEGRSNREPVASNATLAGMARNRRVEVVAVYVEEKVTTQTVMQAGPKRYLECNTARLPQSAMAITLDGQPFSSSDSANNADQQRCADVALENMQLQFKYDPLDAMPKLSIQHALTQSGNTLMLHLRGYSNYSSFIKYAEVLVMAPGDQQVLSKVPLNDNLEGKWRLPSNLLGMSLAYRLRVYDNDGRFDETLLNSADFRPQFAVEPEKVTGYLLTNYGKSQLEKQNIKVQGGTLTLYGEQVPEQHQVFFLGRVVVINRERKFVHQQIVRSGFHRAEVAILDKDGNGTLIHRDLALPKSDWFYVAMADLTVGQNSHNGPVDLLNNTAHKEGELFADGRLAGYITGKWQDEYQVTARLDTREAPLNELFSNIHQKDPKSLFRRLEEQAHPSEFGDDSTTKDDAPSYGKLYLKIAKDDSQVLWGNFNTQINDTELSRVERGLYGLQAKYMSGEITQFGEHTAGAELFVAEAETLPAYETHRATGGSLYYLQYQDIVIGSEQLAIEIRDKVSGLVLVRRSLVAGQDYDIDALQGRILLTKPLSSFEYDDLLVRAASLDNNPTYLIANYEYRAGFSELNNLTYGGRVSQWLNDKVQIGATLRQQKLDDDDDTLFGLDAVYRHSANSYVKAEVAETQGIASTLSSYNGGFSFDNTQSADIPTNAQGLRVEAASTWHELGFNNDGKVNVYWQKLQQGFAGLGQVNADQAQIAGASFTWQTTENTEVKFKADEHKIKERSHRKAIELDISHQLTEQWQVSTGLRADKRVQLNTVASGHSSAQIDDGQRTDSAVQVKYNPQTDWLAYGFVQGTLDKDTTRQANERVGFGGEIEISDAITLKGETSQGKQGVAAIAGVDYAYSALGNVYINYQLDPDGGDLSNARQQRQWVTGTRHRFSDSTSVYGEQQFQKDERQTGITHVYGVDHSINERWQIQLGFENGDIDLFEQGQLARDSVTLGLGYVYQGLRWSGALEYRQDITDEAQSTNWLMRHNFTSKLSPDWRAQLRLDMAMRESNAQNEKSDLNSDFTELQFGFAYRPLEVSPWSGMVSITYLEDLAPSQQLSGIGLNNTPQQRSTVFSLDVNYQLSPRWRVGTKYAQRKGEVRLGRDAGPWFDSTAQLHVLRADYHLAHNWDATIEWRNLAVERAKDARNGALAAIHRHVGEHMKVGVGYNFTEFSDDLTDFDYDSKGWFINLTGKF